METNRAVAARELAKLNEVSALNARRPHHRLVELLTDSDRRGRQDAARQVGGAAGSWAPAPVPHLSGDTWARLPGRWQICHQPGR